MLYTATLLVVLTYLLLMPYSSRWSSGSHGNDGKTSLKISSVFKNQNENTKRHS